MKAQLRINVIPLILMIIFLAALPVYAQTRTATPVPEVSANNQWSPQSEIFDGVEMMLVPPGCFKMGSDDFVDSKPVSNFCFKQPFWIDKNLVTNAQFAAFKGTARLNSRWTNPERPRETLTWNEAYDFCRNRLTRLPTEAEWEYAARGPDNLVYPWGNTFGEDNAVYGLNSKRQTADVGSKPDGASWVGALDMAGNVWEWTSTVQTRFQFSSAGNTNQTIYRYPYNANDGREYYSPYPQDTRVIRGGAWNSGSTNLESAFRSFRHTDWPPYAGNNVGFRCVRDF